MRYFLIILLASLTFSLACRSQNSEIVTIGLSDKFATLNSLTTKESGAAGERIRNLMFNSLVKKNEKFEYVGELAKEIVVSDDQKTITFNLLDNVKFHNGKLLTSADVKYTFDQLMASDGFKRGAFVETIEGKVVPLVASIETPNPQTAVFNLSRSGIKNQVMSNLVPVPIIPEGTIEQQNEKPVGSGPFKFVSFDSGQSITEFEAFPDYWEGAPKVEKIRVKTIVDANSMQAELQSGGVDLAPLPTNLAPDSIKSLGANPNLKVEQFPGSNIQYLQFNTANAPLDKVKLRQAVAYAINREEIINKLLSGQATIAHSILPAESWAYYAPVKYSYDLEKAKQLVKESGYNNELLKFKFNAGSAATSQYAQVIQNSLKEVGLNVEIETLEIGTLREQLAKGQFQMNTGIWIGGNQDPIFLKDLFATGAIPGEKIKCCNRSRYSNPEFDKIIEQALNAQSQEEAKTYYFKAQEIVANDVPMLPLWYPANIVISNKRIGNIKIGASGEWNFVKDITLEKK
ncbi:MAG: ABC transporter substrate-binding protein [Pyrinomonadaceae bacterium]|nr:ABC transporter substrate-binding protein [Pyrinomonadaceae bacterium]